jgi:hypothetical protein
MNTKLVSHIGVSGDDVNGEQMLVNFGLGLFCVIVVINFLIFFGGCVLGRVINVTFTIKCRGGVLFLLFFLLLELIWEHRAIVRELKTIRS